MCSLACIRIVQKGTGCEAQVAFLLMGFANMLMASV